MKTDMPDKDITLGEVYRAVLSLKEDFTETRKDIADTHNMLRDDIKAQGLQIKELEIKNQVLERENKLLTARSGILEDRIRVLEGIDSSRTTDPWARIGAALSGAGGLLYWWLHNKSGGQ